MPLADSMRPKTIDDVVGQSHLIGDGKVLRRIIETKNIPNMIFFGPPGVGKTTVANLIAKVTDRRLYKLNATTASTKDIHEIINQLDNLMNYNGVVLYLDEIQNFNKKQQQALLEPLESGKIILIASTTENPHFAIYSAILSRCVIFEFKHLNRSDITKGLIRAVDSLDDENISYDIEALEFIADIAKGDMRKALNILETTLITNMNEKRHISIDGVKELGQESLYMDESKYYDWVSCLHKSIRGSDADASVLALGVLLKAGRMEEVCRRLLVIGSEDCGLAMGNMYSTFFSLISAAKMVGMPEAQIILSHAVILLATSPKSNSAYKAISKAMNDISNKDIGEVPIHLRDSHYSGALKLGIKGYKYPHDYPNNYVKQQYMTDNLEGTIYYEPDNNKYEKSLIEYWKKIKGE